MLDNSDELRAGWEAYLAVLLKGHNQDLVRIKIVLADSNEE